MKRFIMVSYALLAYAIGSASIVALMLFLADIPIWKTVSQGKNIPFNGSWFSNFTVVLVYFALHSIMARPAFKRWWTGFVSTKIERATYVLVAGITTLLLIWCWTPFTAVIWDLSDTVYANIIYGFFALGWVIGILSTFILDHLSFFGIKQSFNKADPIQQTQQTLIVKYLYKFVRHPISLGWFIVFWSTPIMTAGHLLLAVSASLYILIVTPIEEADLIEEIGDEYRNYQKSTGKFLPVIIRPRNAQRSER